MELDTLEYSDIDDNIYTDKRDCYDQLAEDYQRVEQAILFLERNAQRQPGLKEIAEIVLTLRRFVLADVSAVALSRGQQSVVQGGDRLRLTLNPK